MTDRIIVTCVQERLDNSILTVRINGTVVARVYRDTPQEWVVLPPEVKPTPQPRYKSLTAAIDALIAEQYP